MDGINKWNIDEVRSTAEQIGSAIDDSNFKNIFKIFENKLILLLIDQVLERSDDLEINLQAFLNKVPLLTEAYRLVWKINDQALTKKVFEENLDNFITLGLFSLHAGTISAAIHYFGEGLKLFEDVEAYFPKKHSFILGLLSNLMLKIRSIPKIVNFAQKILDLDSNPFEIAHTFIKRAISIDTSLKNTSGLALDHYNMALLYLEQHEHDRGLEEIKQAHQLHEDLEDREGMFDDILLLGELLNKKGHKDKALQVYHQALEICVQLDWRYNIGLVNYLLSGIHRENHEYEKSLKHLRTALVIFKQEKAGNEMDLANAYTGLGTLLRQMQNFPGAKGFLSKILNIEKKGGSKALLMEIHAQLAMTNACLNDDGAFQQSYHEVLALYDDVKDPAQYARIEYEIGATFSNLQTYQEGATHLGKALKLYYELQDEAAITTILKVLSQVFTKMEKSDLAKEISDETIDVMTRSKRVLEDDSMKAIEIPEIPPIIPESLLAPKVEEEIPSPKAPVSPPTPTPQAPKVEPPKAPFIPTAVPIVEPEPEPPTVSRPKPKPKLPVNIPLIKAEHETLAGRTCSNCGYDVMDPNFHFCPKCATKLPPPPRVCKKCGFVVIDPEFTYCPKCAVNLD